MKLAAPEPEALRLIGEEAEGNGTDALTSRQIDQVIKAARAHRKKRSSNASAAPGYRYQCSSFRRP
jgi:hypothetical protein